MGKFLKEIKEVYGLTVPKNVDDIWLKYMGLQRYYTCKFCGDTHVSIWQATHVEEIYGKRIVCPKCAKLLRGDITEEAYPVAIN